MSAPNHPWNILPVEPIGDEQDTPLYAAIGRALSTWESIEGILGRIFALLCNAEFDGASRAYGVVSSFNARKDMLDEAFANFPQRGKLPEFPKLLKRIKEFSGRRNEIAHGVVCQVGFNSPMLGYYILPALYNSRKRIAYEQQSDQSASPELRPWHFALKYAYTANQVEYYRDQFFALLVETQAVADRLGALAREAFEKKNRC